MSTFACLILCFAGACSFDHRRLDASSEAEGMSPPAGVGEDGGVDEGEEGGDGDGERDEAPLADLGGDPDDDGDGDARDPGTGPAWDTDIGERCDPASSVCRYGGTCFESIGGDAARCHEPCDPFEPACETGSVCAITYARDEAVGAVQFSCYEDPTPHEPQLGDHCSSSTGCGLGQLCSTASDVGTSCDAEDGCCVALCTVGEHAPCPSDADVCVPLFAWTSPYEHIGRCLPA